MGVSHDSLDLPLEVTETGSDLGDVGSGRAHGLQLHQVVADGVQQGGVEGWPGDRGGGGGGKFDI